MARVCSRLLVPFLRCSFIYPSRTLPRQLTRPPIEAQGDDHMSKTNKPRPKMTTSEKRLAYFEKMLKRLCTDLGAHPSGTRAYEKATGMFLREMSTALPVAFLDRYLSGQCRSLRGYFTRVGRCPSGWRRTAPAPRMRGSAGSSARSTVTAFPTASRMSRQVRLRPTQR